MSATTDNAFKNTLGNRKYVRITYIQYVKMKLRLSCNKHNIKYHNSVFIKFISFKTNYTGGQKESLTV